MNSEREANDILHAIKSVKETPKEAPSEILYDSATAMLQNASLTPVVAETGSVYTAQNNMVINNQKLETGPADTIDVDYSYQSITRKPYYIKSFQITPTSTIGSAVYTLSLPGNYFGANRVLTNIGNTFNSFRGTFHVLISVQGSPQYSGALIAHAVYTATPVMTPDERFFCEALYRHHVILDYSDNSSTADLVIPFRWNANGCYPYLPAHKVEFRPLVVLAGGTSVTCTVSVFLEDQEFRFLRPLVSSAFAEEGTREAQGLFNFTTVNNTLGDVTNSTLPTNITGDSLDLQPRMMDAVPLALNPTPMIVKYNSFNNSDNPFPVERMTMKSGATRVSDKTTFGIDVDEMDIVEICKRDNFLKTFNITTSTAVNSAVYATYVTPSTLWQAPDYFNPMTFIATKFRNWRGGLKYKLRFYMTRFQSVKLYAAMFYKSTEPSLLTDFSGSHGVVLDIGGDKREVEIEIPYNSEYNWCQNPYRANQDLPSDSVQRFALGKFVVYAMTPLISPTGGPLSITCVVSVSCSDDFEFSSYCPVSTETQGLLKPLQIAKPSTRTDDIQDTVKSLKTFFKRYYDATDWVQQVDLNKYSVYGNFIYPTVRATNLSAGSDSIYNRTLVASPFHLRTPLAGIYSGYRGGVTVRIVMTYALIDADLALTKRLVPFCLYFNPAFYNQNQTAWQDSVVKTLNNFLLNKLDSVTRAAPTPYVVQPLNPETVSDATSVIYELDVPYQAISKYSWTLGADGFWPHGVIIAGFYDPLKQEIGEETLVNFTIHSSFKCSDDGRFGILENGALTATNPDPTLTSWGAAEVTP